MSSVFKVTAPISDACRSHLLQVYSLLTAGVVTAATGCYIDMTYLHWGNMYLAIFGALLFGIASRGSDNFTGSLLFLSAAFLEGMSLSPLVHVASLYYPGALITALLSSVAVFGSFSAAAVLARRREFFFLSGIVGTVAMYLAIMSVANLVLRSPVIVDVQIYGGLAMFLGYVLVDTQVMIERFETGANWGNFVRPACDLFLDLVGIFVRILVILMRKGSEKRRQSGPQTSSPERRYYKRHTQ